VVKFRKVDNFYIFSVLEIVMHYFWLISGFVILFFEIFFPGLFFFLSLSFACFLVAVVVALFQVTLWGQCMLVLASSLCFFMILQQVFKKKNKSSGYSSNIEKLIGLEGIVIKEVSCIGFGQVKIINEVWTAVCLSDEKIDKNIVVVVKGIQGNKLIVSKKIND
jgi:membrane protein implicated in regulation of membrane protease activity